MRLVSPGGYVCQPSFGCQYGVDCAPHAHRVAHVLAAHYDVIASDGDKALQSTPKARRQAMRHACVRDDERRLTRAVVADGAM